jgi:hypothetical protein
VVLIRYANNSSIKPTLLNEDFKLNCGDKFAKIHFFFFFKNIYICHRRILERNFLSVDTLFVLLDLPFAKHEKMSLNGKLSH